MEEISLGKKLQNINRALIGWASAAERTNIYYIDIVGGNKTGFFALLRTVLVYMCYADEMGFIPYIIYRGETLYLEDKPVKGTRNVYEYYFKQIFDQKKVLLPWRINLRKANSDDFEETEYKYNGREFSYLVKNEYIARMSEIYKRYIRLTDDTERYIKQEIRKKINRKKTLGIHIRGTDFNKVFDNHPIPVTVEEYVSAINEIFEKDHYEQLFVATDDKRCLSDLVQRLSVPIVYYEDTARSVDDKSVAFIRSQRKNDRYLLGLEVLRDVYTLAYCTGFIGCLSQVDVFVQIIRKSRGKDFVYKKIINKGISSNGKMCWEPRE
ncbi:MAG: O-fucosyltransferase family protein [Ruminococcus sp.]|nr:O-fucosyltransferase family protein [Ruminococcus sp.]